MRPLEEADGPLQKTLLTPEKRRFGCWSLHTSIPSPGFLFLARGTLTCLNRAGWVSESPGALPEVTLQVPSQVDLNIPNVCDVPEYQRDGSKSV